MTNLRAYGMMVCALAFSLAGCVASGPAPYAAHLSPTQCRDLTDLRNHAPLTRERNGSEIAALRSAGYDPSRWFDPYYPDDLQAAQVQVDRWYAQDCQQAQPN